jgi:hypothetical protein
LAAFSGLFVKVVQLAREAGLVKLGRVGIDGTKVKANASKRKAMSYGRMREEEQRLKAEIAALLTRAEGEDRDEDRRYGKAERGDALPDELQRREARLRAIQAAKARLEARGREAHRQGPRDDEPPEGHAGDGAGSTRDVPADKAQDNFTDPESRIMKTGDGFQQCYNAQAAVDEDSRLIVATTLNANGSDNRQLLPVIKAIQATTGATPAMTLADAGYASEANFKALEAEHLDACVALGREGKRGQAINAQTRPATARMAARLATDEGRDHYRRRKFISEPTFGWIKQALGFRQFSLRGLAAVTGEWNLVCLAINLRRLHRLGWMPT